MSAVEGPTKPVKNNEPNRKDVMDCQFLPDGTLSISDELMEIVVEGVNDRDNGVQANSACVMPVEETNFNDRGHTFTYKENDLFHFLNHPTNLQGRIILGRYKLSKHLDYARLKEMVITREIIKDPISYKIKSEAFVALREQIVELFPTEDPELLFVPYYKSPTGNSLSARGCLYNEYKFIRNQLRGAGLLRDDEQDVSNFDEGTDKALDTCVCLTSPQDHSTTDIIRKWEETFGARHELLVPSEKKKKPVSTQQYLDSFQCLNQQLGLLLLESDFDEILNIRFKEEVNTKELLLTFKTLFVETWPVHAANIMKLCKSSRSKDVQNFLKDNTQSVNAGNNNSVLALFLLPLCVTVPKSLKRKDLGTIHVNKSKITNCFILHVQYEEFKIGETFTKKSVGNKMVLVPESVYGIHVPLRETLKIFLEIPGLFTQVIEHMNNLRKESHVMTNITQGNLWLSKYSTQVSNEILLPIFLFYDDLEVGNPLGSHAGINKFGAVYASIACLPDYIASRLSSMLFSTLVYVEDKKRFCNQKVFRKVIEEINFLKTNGITITVDGVLKKVKFQLVLILGDNLGLNGIFGFVESFRGTYCCRICKASSATSSTLAVEDISLLRNRENYEEDVKIADASRTGVKEGCVFHKIHDFHITKNVTVDVMHDVLEGVALYVMDSVISTFVNVKQYFSLEFLNSTIQNFEFGPIENSNKPTQITMNRLKSKSHLKMSASETLCLVRYFGLMIGNKIPVDDEHWQLYKYLRRIIDIVTSPRLTRSDCKALKKLVEDHNNLYVKLFGTLTAKFHNMLHYPRIIVDNGPCINFSCMRFEARHRQLKLNSTSSSSSKNILKTIATKQMLQMCQTIHSPLCEIVTLGSVDDTNYETTLQYPQSKCYKKIEISGTPYKIGTFVVSSIRDIEKEFGEITKIVKVKDDILFHMNVLIEVTFDEHFHAYIVRKCNRSKVLKYTDLSTNAPCLSVIRNETHFIATRYAL